MLFYALLTLVRNGMRTLSWKFLSAIRKKIIATFPFCTVPEFDRINRADRDTGLTLCTMPLPDRTPILHPDVYQGAQLCTGRAAGTIVFYIEFTIVNKKPVE